jgi:YihY family inner membrane protein
VTLSAVQGLIALVGVATAFGHRAVSDVIVTSVEQAAPGPVAHLLTQAIVQAQRDGASHRYVGLVFGTVGFLISSTTALGQLERGLNRIYGVEKDRDAARKYGLAGLLAISVGLLIALAAGLLAFGRSFASSVDNPTLAQAWDLVSWPLGVALLGAGVALLFRWCPRRRQPAWSWLAFGAAVALGLWVVVTVALGAFFRHSGSFGETYGPLAGIVALMLWALLMSVSLFFGAAVAAQLEAVRSQAAQPQDPAKVAESEPSAARPPAADEVPELVLGGPR